MSDTKATPPTLDAELTRLEELWRKASPLEFSEAFYSTWPRIFAALRAAEEVAKAIQAQNAHGCAEWDCGEDGRCRFITATITALSTYRAAWGKG